MQVLRVARVRKGSREVVTLHVETTTPRRRTLQTSYERQCTPSAEQYDERRKRTKAESSARNRAMCRLDATRHDAYREKERERKRGAPKRERVQETAATSISLPAWKVRELDAWKQREAERLQKEAEAIAPQIAQREAAGYKRIRLGPRGWCDVGGWIRQDPQARKVNSMTFHGSGWTTTQKLGHPGYGAKAMCVAFAHARNAESLSTHVHASIQIPNVRTGVLCDTECVCQVSGDAQAGRRRKKIGPQTLFIRF